MGQNESATSSLDGTWGEFVTRYQPFMDAMIPYLPAAEQGVYQRLSRLSHGRRNPYGQCRYEDLALACGLSLRTLPRALKGLKHKQVVKTVWQRHGATTVTVRLPWELARTPAFLLRHSVRVARSPSRLALTTPPVYDTFTPEERELFVTCTRSLSPDRLNTLIEEAVEWLSTQTHGDPTAFSDERLRDKVDELVFHEVFGTERRIRYEALFCHLYAILAEVKSA